MDSLGLDIRHACRSLLKRPGFTALAVLTLALGLGVNAVAFTAISALLLRPFQIPNADRLGWIMLESRGNPYGSASLEDLKTLKTSTRAFETIAAEGRLPVSLRTPAGGEQAWALAITADYLQILEARPVVGRPFAPGDLQEGDLPAVVSYRFWQDKLGAPASLGGQTIVVNGRSFSVVGVLPDDFQGIGGVYAPDMWIPLERLEVLDLPSRYFESEWLTLFGRLSPGVSAAQAEGELASVSSSLPSVFGRADIERTAKFHVASGGHPEAREIGKVAWMAFAAVAVVLLIACFNVAALLLARASERQKEIGVRTALGASRGRILRQMVLEGLLLASMSGIAALIVASWSADLLATFSLPSPIPQRLHLRVDWLLVVFTAVMVAVAGVLPALLPAFQATRGNLLRSIRMESVLGGRPSRTRNAFVVTQIAGSTLFVVAALLFGRSFMKNVAVPVGFDTEHTIALRLSPALYGYDAAGSRALIDRLRERIAALPGVANVAVANQAPFYVGFAGSTTYSADGSCVGADCRRAITYAVSRGHFDALGVPLRAGRDFTDAELRSGTAVIVSERLAAQLWPGESAVGRSFRIGEERRPVDVIGVSAEYIHRTVTEPPLAYLYRPITDAEFGSEVTVIVRAHDSPASLMTAVREQVRALDPNLPSAAIETMADRMKMPQWMPRTIAGFFMICGTLALVLATVGLFGVMYFTVSQRTREFGIRIAIGATRARVMSVVLREGLRLAVPGVLLGVTGGYLVARLLSKMLFGVAPADPVSFGGTALLQVLVALAACALPAYRATKADPIVALRQE